MKSIKGFPFQNTEKRLNSAASIEYPFEREGKSKAKDKQSFRTQCKLSHCKSSRNFKYFKK